MRISVRGPVRLILLSFLMLFLELALIRWAGANILYLSYFSNFILLASFLGIGVGFLSGRSRTDLFAWAPLTLAALVAFVLVFPVQIDRSGSELIYFAALNASRTGLPTWLTLPIIFLATAALMSMVAQGVARTFTSFPPLEAYRLDILGSLLGIGTFSLLSFTGMPPLAWGLVVAVLFAVLLLPRVRPHQAVALTGLLLMLGVESSAALISWSPYYKVRVQPNSNGSIAIFVNGIPHQTIQSVAQREEAATGSIYAAPYALAPSHRNVLIVGAGTGNDVAMALAKGARHVDAVEIDPRLYQIGRQSNPNHPYQDPRVSAHINDGRAFLEQSTRRYDLIVFALPDSLTLVSGQSSLRLESYLFTREAMVQARAHLGPDGTFAMYNYYRQQWLVDRLANTLKQVFGESPCVEAMGGSVGHLAVLTATRNPAALNCTTRWLSAVNAPQPATDDYPFLYLRDRGIPAFYLLTLALILLASLLIVRGAAGSLAAMAGYLDLFLMGAAFMLLETKNVVQFALLFGTTWFVNALVFGGILVAVFLAIEVARRFSIKQPAFLYLALGLALAMTWLVPPEMLLRLTLIARIAAAVVLAFLPIFFANLVFAERFRATSSSGMAFGANLLGAMVGGVLEYASLITGYRFLLVIIALLYGGAFLLQRRPSLMSRTGSQAAAVSARAV